MKKKWNRKAWAAAACLCLIAVGAFAGMRMDRAPVGGGAGGPMAGGADPVGSSDAGMYSVAVFPDERQQEEVETAEVFSLTEEELAALPLAAYLPKELPEGFHYGRGSRYETVMKDGVRYQMLRVEYISGEVWEQQFAEDGGAIVPPPGVEGDHFLVMVLDHRPKGLTKLYQPEEVTRGTLEEGGIPFIQYGGVYVGVGAETAGAEVAFEALARIGS